MKVHPVTLETFTNLHPSIALFRSLELKTIYDSCHNLKFDHPSLDLGCGHGEIAKLVFHEQFDFGLDNGEIDEYKSAIQKKMYKKFLLESAEKMSIPNDSINFIFSNSVIEHIPDNEAVLSEASRVLKKGGHFLFTVPCGNFSENLYFVKLLPWPLSRVYIHYRNKMLNHYHLYNHKEWEKRLNKAGLSVVHYKYYTSKKALNLWDKMASLALVGKLLSIPLTEKFLFNRYCSQISLLFQSDCASPKNGSCLLIIAQK